MNAQEEPPIELGLEGTKTFAHEVARRPDMQPDIVVRCLDPVHLVGADEKCATVGLDGDPR